MNTKNDWSVVQNRRKHSLLKSRGGRPITSGNQVNFPSTQRPATPYFAPRRMLSTPPPTIRLGAPALHQLCKDMLLVDPGPDGLVWLVDWPVNELVVELELKAKAVEAAERSL